MTAASASSRASLAHRVVVGDDDLSERCNVVLTHTNADFDTLAGAVALAKLWSIERPSVPTHVVMPRGVNPLVGRFIAYHKHLLPIRGFKTIRAEDVVAVGVVDTQSIDRLGPAAPWLETAEHVAVVDHHMGVSGDIHPDEFILEAVGSATTVLVEKLRALFEAEQGDGGGMAAASAPSAADASDSEAPTDAPAPLTATAPARTPSQLKLTETEATLLALGIRADTGAFRSRRRRSATSTRWRGSWSTAYRRRRSPSLVRRASPPRSVTCSRSR